MADIPVIWRPIDGYDGDYEVSSHGEVRSRKTGHYRKMALKFNRFTGYYYVILGYNGESKTHSVHRLVANAFLPNPNCLPIVNHKDENKTNNCVSNLEWCTEKYNTEYSAHSHCKKVDAFTPDGEYVATFNSVNAAAMFLGVTKAAVSMAAKGDRSSCAGFILKLKEE